MTNLWMAFRLTMFTILFTLGWKKFHLLLITYVILQTVTLAFNGGKEF